MKSTTPFLIANLVIAVLGFGLAVASLVWQTFSWKLSGGRAKAVAKLGAFHAAGHSLVQFDETAGREAMEHAIKQGYTHPVVVLTVSNVGRLQVTVTAWKIVTAGGSFRPVRFISGPDLPHTLSAGGAPETWAVDAEEVRHFVTTMREELKKHGDVRVDVELGDGKMISTSIVIEF